ncbi:MAG: tRNA (adenosine(37)-N6)-threonylcarbamoyltransferase complex dimerization subunit type 1 TsaB [Saprospiraceae bacterium]|nr:tRNA (adenosine(37)-N6)-threonylcarbamoyltransferase complex dimerization subunit type 1 TsaB [Saprospiraceae bacterium]
MSLILNIESATDICSIAISQNGVPLALCEAQGNHHAEQITLLINDCLKTCDIPINALDAVAISNGPGSYTSLRIGASTAKGICYALNIPLIAVDTLDSLAWATFKDMADNTALYCPMIDARRMEVYTTLFQVSKMTGELEKIEPMQPKIIDENSYSEFFEKNKKIIFSGSGASKCTTVLTHANAVILNHLCSAKNLIALSEKKFLEKKFVDIAYHTPQYLKAPNITQGKKQL